MFPEGTRNKYFEETGQLLPFHNGAVYWARDTYAPIIPVAITGEHKRGGELLVRVGKPIRVAGDASDSEVKNTTAILRNQIYEMVLENLLESKAPKDAVALQNARSFLETREDPASKEILKRLKSK